jgi:hypothetical protein
MGDTLSRMADIEGKDVFGRPLDAKHTTLVAQDVPSRLEFIAVHLMAGMLASDEGPFTATELAQEAVEYAKALRAALDAEGKQ